MPKAKKRLRKTIEIKFEAAIPLDDEGGYHDLVAVISERLAGYGKIQATKVRVEFEPQKPEESKEGVRDAVESGQENQEGLGDQTE